MKAPAGFRLVTSRVMAACTMRVLTKLMICSITISRRLDRLSWMRSQPRQGLG
jgi:hypothetical protein